MSKKKGKVSFTKPECENCNECEKKRIRCDICGDHYGKPCIKKKKGKNVCVYCNE